MATVADAVSTSSTGRPASAAVAQVLRDDAFLVPVLPTNYVERSRLTELLGPATSAPLTIVTAPSGTGKSTLLAAVARARPPGTTAWCTLGGRSTESTRFAKAVLHAVIGARAVGGTERVAAVRAASPDPIEQALQLAADGPHLLLVLDNADGLRSRTARAALQRLVHDAPAALSVVLIARRDLDFRVELRTGMHPVTLREADITFTESEVADLFERFAVDVSPGELECLTTWTGGSAAAIALAALSMRTKTGRRRLIAEARAGECAVNDYLTTAVLDRQPAELRDFILQTSIVDVVDRDLAAAITGNERASEHLAALARDQLFLTAVDGWPGWYRHHSMLADLLRAALTHGHGDQVRELHRRAAHWFLDANHPEEAARHAIAASDWTLAAAVIIDQWTVAALQGAPCPVAGFSRAVPDDGPERADFAVLAAIRAYEGGDREGTRAGLDRADALGVRVDETLALPAAIIRLALELETNGVDPQIDAAADALLALREAHPGPADQSDHIEILVLLARAKARYREGDLDAASDFLEHAIDASTGLGRNAMSAAATARLALITALQGRLRTATAYNEELGEFWATANAPIPRSGRDLTLAICAYHRDDLPTARRELAAATQRLPPGVSRDVVTNVVAARLAASDGDDAAAQRFLASAAESGCTALFSVACDAMGIGQPGAGASTHPYARTRRQLEAARAHWSTGDRVAALDAIERALAIVDRYGYRRAFVDFDASMRTLLVAYVAEVRAFRMIASQLLDRMSVGDGSAPRYVERMTERELTVLRYLPTMMSNSEIASEMYFSVNTVKTHLKSIYRKLGVTRRRDAVQRAYELDLI